MSSENLLIELGTEELPPKALKTLATSFAGAIEKSLRDAGVVGAESATATWFAAPRRLAIRIDDVSAMQNDRVEQRRGPSVAAAFDDNGEPTKAVMGFARSCGVEVDVLQRVETDKGEWLMFDQTIAGESIEQLVDQALDVAVRQLPIPKRMRWGDSDQEFVRPVHWLLALHGDRPLPVSVLGLDAGNTTRGHRFHAPEEIIIDHADHYASVLLQQGRIMVDYQERQNTIVEQVNALAGAEGATAVMEPALLDEVTGLVEWPVALLGKFDDRFLDVPSEVLVSSMSDHQKYFHLVDSSGKLQPGFVTVSNIESNNPERVRSGNERVLRARLSDAEFFWLGDQKTSLESRIDQLKRVLFHKKLGSVHDKIGRISSLALTIAAETDCDSALVERACLLCKTDLVTDMVGEFPELQGTIGRYYAANQGESAEVALAIESHYQPRFAGDMLPVESVSRCLALADRIDSLVGIFGCGEIPTGDKDPYALRRSALGVLRILIESGLNLDLRALITQSAESYQTSGITFGDDTAVKVFVFVIERLRAYYQPLGFDSDLINAVMAVVPDKPLDFDRRIRALQQFATGQTEAAQSLAAANKRIANILAKQEVLIPAEIDQSLLSLDAEKQLVAAVNGTAGQARDAFADGDYLKGLTELATLKPQVDAFFDDVMVMDEDPAVRNNRLALLNQIRHAFLEVADISLLRVEASS